MMSARYADLAFGGSSVPPKRYMLGYWDADDLTTVLRVLLANRSVLDDLESRLPRRQDRCSARSAIG